MGVVTVECGHGLQNLLPLHATVIVYRFNTYSVQIYVILNWSYETKLKVPSHGSRKKYARSHNVTVWNICKPTYARAKCAANRVFTALAKKATKYSIMAVSRATSDKGVSSTASGAQQQVSTCRPIHNLWQSRVEKSAFKVTTNLCSCGLWSFCEAIFALNRVFNFS